MNRVRAMRYVGHIVQRLQEVGGVIDTPLCDHLNIRILKIELFGSVAKGKQEPNDVDLMVTFEYGPANTDLVEFDANKQRSYGYQWRWCVMEARTKAFRWLKHGMLKVSLHGRDVEEVMPDVIYEVYPQWKLPKNL